MDCRGLYTKIGGKSNRYATFTIGAKAKSNNLADPELNMKRVFASHTELVTQLVQNIFPKYTDCTWQLISAMHNSNGPTWYPHQAYEACTLQQLFKIMKIDLIRDRQKISLAFYNFTEIEIDNEGEDTKPKGKKGKSLKSQKRSHSDIRKEYGSDSSSSSPVKEALRAIKEEVGIKKEVGTRRR